MDVGDRIRLRRQELGMTQTELANALGLKSKAAISTVENNKEDLTTERIKKYAIALKTTPSYLMGWTNQREDSEHSSASETSMLSPKEIELLNLARRHNITDIVLSYAKFLSIEDNKKK